MATHVFCHPPTPSSWRPRLHWGAGSLPGLHTARLRPQERQAAPRACPGGVLSTVSRWLPLQGPGDSTPRAPCCSAPSGQAGRHAGPCHLASRHPWAPPQPIAFPDNQVLAQQDQRSPACPGTSPRRPAGARAEVENPCSGPRAMYSAGTSTEPQGPSSNPPLRSWGHACKVCNPLEIPGATLARILCYSFGSLLACQRLPLLGLPPPPAPAPSCREGRVQGSCADQLSCSTSPPAKCLSLGYISPWCLGQMSMFCTTFAFGARFSQKNRLSECDLGRQQATSRCW